MCIFIYCLWPSNWSWLGSCSCLVPSLQLIWNFPQGLLYSQCGQWDAREPDAGLLACVWAWTDYVREAQNSALRCIFFLANKLVNFKKYFMYFICSNIHVNWLLLLLLLLNKKVCKYDPLCSLNGQYPVAKCVCSSDGYWINELRLHLGRSFGI